MNRPNKLEFDPGKPFQGLFVSLKIHSVRNTVPVTCTIKKLHCSKIVHLSLLMLQIKSL
jgi:hypothetical protein